jgi:hypothetical protein
MVTDVRIAHSTAPVDSSRKLVLAAGLLYIATFVFSIPAAFGLYDGVLNDPNFVFGSGGDDGVLWGAMFEIITALAGIGTAVVLYPVIRRYGRVGALGFVTSRVLEAAMIFVGVLTVLSIFTLRQDLAGADAPGLVTTTDSLLAMKDWTFLLGPGLMAVVNALCLGSVLYRSGLVPRIIPALGLVGAPLLLASDIGTLFGWHDQVSGTAMVMMLPVGIWELSVGVWMTVKGFKVTTVGGDAPISGRAAAYRGVTA